MVREDGVQVKFVISQGCWERFKAEISVNKPYIYKGLLSNEAENAFNHYIVYLRKTRSNMQHSTRQRQNVKKMNDTIELRDKILHYLQDTEVEHTDGVFRIAWPYGIPPQRTVHIDYLHQAIVGIKGIDRRTFDKWTRRLLETGLIEGTGPKTYKFCEEKPKIIDTSLDKASSSATQPTSKVNEQPATVRE